MYVFLQIGGLVRIRMRQLPGHRNNVTEKQRRRRYANYRYPRTKRSDTAHGVVQLETGRCIKARRIRLAFIRRLLLGRHSVWTCVLLYEDSIDNKL